MEEKTGLVSCNCELKISVYTFLLPLLFIFVRYFRDEVFDRYKPEFGYKLLKYNLPYLFYLYLPKLFSIIFILIIKYMSKGETSSSNNNIRITNYHITVEKKKRRIWLLFFIISLLEVLQDDGDCLLYYHQKIYYKEGNERIIKGWLIEKKTGYIFFVPIFSYFILHTEIHRHHILALILGYIGAIFVNACRFFLDFSTTEDYPYHLLNGFFSFLYSLALVLIKYTLTKYILLSPYVFLFYDGIFCIINSIIVTLLQYPMIINLPEKNREIDESKENDRYFSNNFLEIIKIFWGEDGGFYLYFFLSFIFSFFYYIVNILILFNYSPYLIILVEAFLPLDTDIIKIIIHQENEYIRDNKSKMIERFHYQTFGYAVLFFAALILNEIIIFNCYGFNKNTFAKINKRGQFDSNVVIELDPYENDSNSEIEDESNSIINISNSK